MYVVRDPHTLCVGNSTTVAHKKTPLEPPRELAGLVDLLGLFNVNPVFS